ncbi:MAG: HU family DNA-binding protein [Flavobacteriaceae bacterium]
MNKAELVAAVADETGLTKQAAGEAVDATFAAITGALKKGDEVKIPGFGGFAVTQTKARTGRNPLTGATIQVKASKRPKFKVGKALKDAVAG